MKPITIEEVSPKQAEVEIINSIKHSHKDLRQRSKGCTFALTYAGTWRTLVQNFGFSEQEAKNIEARYHELYKESDEWVSKKMKKAAVDGYVDVAFGLRVRTPVMHQCILGLRNTPKEAEAEKRTAGNALGQSYGLLNSRAGMAFNRKVRESKYALSIRPVAQIHDAQYFLVKDDAETLLWMNKHLVEETSWQEDPAISHPEVHLGGEVSIFYPDWAHECVIPNDVNSYTQLSTVINDYLKELKK